MEHTNLFLYEDNAAMLADYANGKVDSPVPGVAYARADENSGATVIYNKKKTTYTVTVSHQDRSGNTVTANTTVTTPVALEGKTVKVNIVAEEISGYKPVYPVEKIEVSADTAHTCIYLTAVTYVVTVHHMSQGSAITADTTVQVPAYEEETVDVELVPMDIQGYETPETVTISVSSDTEYTFNYEVGCPLELVDLGLPSGTLWATKNLGASTPEDFGDFYAWGEIAPKTEFTDENYRFYVGPDQEYSKYNSTDGKHVLDLEDDAAALAYPSCGAHLPTVAQMYELLNNTTYEYHEGSVEQHYTSVTFTSIINGNSIVMPLDEYYQEGSWGDYPALWLRDEIIYGDADYEGQTKYDNGMGYAGALLFACEGNGCVADVIRNGQTGYGRGQHHGNGLNIRPVVGDGPEPNPFVGDGQSDDKEA